ncbi:ribonuclease III [Teratosphaeria nubilosa]|uniref:Ribonuclease III n=1 Tax=Teratosphaeria nubilosa TaxID=161662 RepID=A0A6G1KU96_9PEZI|nr:ribonuclease III [Teratosphaeria nubilosa]
MSFRKLEQAKTLLEQVANYTFHDDNLLNEAIDTTGLRSFQSNQRLALLGDAVLKHVILDEWYPTGTSKGDGNNLVSTIGSNSSLAAAALRVGLGHCIVVNPGHQGRLSNGMLSTAVEALLGAIYLDSGKDMATVRITMSAFGLTHNATS